MNLVQRTPVGAVFRYRSGGGFCIPAHAWLVIFAGVYILFPGYMLWIPRCTASIGDAEE